MLNLTYEFSLPQKFVERRYGLDPLTDRDSQANDLLDSFDFDQDHYHWPCRRGSARSDRQTPSHCPRRKMKVAV